MLRAAVAAKTPLGIKAKEAMDKVGFFYIVCLLLVVMVNNVVLVFDAKRIFYNGFAGRTCF